MSDFSFLLYMTTTFPEFSNDAEQLVFNGSLAEALQQIKTVDKHKTLVVYLHNHHNSNEFIISLFNNKDLLSFLKNPRVMFICALFESEDYRQFSILGQRFIADSYFSMIAFHENDVREILSLVLPTSSIEVHSCLVEALATHAMQRVRIGDKRRPDNNDEFSSAMTTYSCTPKRPKPEAAVHNAERIVSYREEVLLRYANNENKAGRVLLKFPNGNRYVLCFDPNELISLVFDAAIIHEACPRYMCIESHFPKQAIPCMPTWYVDMLAYDRCELAPIHHFQGDTFASFGLQSNTILFIYSLK